MEEETQASPVSRGQQPRTSHRSAAERSFFPVCPSLHSQLERTGDGGATARDIALIYGSTACAGLELKLADYFVNGRSSLRSRELQQLICWVLGEDLPPKWVFVKNKPLIPRIVLLVVDGLTSERLLEGEDGRELKETLRAHFDQPTPQPIPLYTSHSAFNRSSVLADYLSCAIMRDKEKEKQERKKRQKLINGAAADATDASTPEESPPHPLKYLKTCIVTEEELALHQYPRPAMEGAEEYRRTCAKEDCTLLHASKVQPVLAAFSSSSSQITVEDFTKIESYQLTQEWLNFPCVHVRVSEQKEMGPEERKEVEKDHENSHMHSSDDTSVSAPTAPLSSSSASSVLGEPDPAATSAAAPSSPASLPNLFAIDCEMCYTSLGLELTRCTLLDSAGAVLFDTFVLPPRPVVDWNTKYSGITPQMLQGCKTTLEEVRVKLTEYLKPTDILVGHSLENDLKALKLLHRNCLDSALLYTHARGPPFKNALRHLALKHLDRTIQQGSQGHDSREDALAALDLVRLKLQFGRKFGEPQREREPLARVLARSGKKCALIGPPSSITDIVIDEPLYSAIMKPATEVTQAIVRECGNERTDLVIGVLSELRSTRRNNIEKPSESTPVGAAAASSVASASVPPSSSASGASRLRSSLDAIFGAALPNTLILLASGHGLGAAQSGGENNKQGLLSLAVVRPRPQAADASSSLGRNS